MDYFTELFKHGNNERKEGEYLVVKTDKPFAEFRAEVYGTHMALHKYKIIDIDGNETEINEQTLPYYYLGFNFKILHWRPGRVLDSEEAQTVFEQIVENNMCRISGSKAFFNL
jgi:hypothetical protein